MNDRLQPFSSEQASPLADGLVDAALPAGARLGPFEFQYVVARSESAVVYHATDHSLALPVAIQEYLPARLVRRRADHALHTIDEWQEDIVNRGLRAFVDEARLLARCDHPALLRVLQLREANGTAYRVMPFYRGERLQAVRREMQVPPDEPALRALADHVLGAIGVIHAAGQSHGDVSAGNILLRTDDRPLLLGPGAASAEVGSNLVESLMATIDTTSPQALEGASRRAPTGKVADLAGLAEVLRFCILGRASAPLPEGVEPEPIAAVIAASRRPAGWPVYSPQFLDALDATLSPYAEDRPLDVAQMRIWLADGPPRSWRRPTAHGEDATISFTPIVGAGASLPAASSTTSPAVPASASTSIVSGHGPSTPPLPKPPIVSRPTAVPTLQKSAVVPQPQKPVVVVAPPRVDVATPPLKAVAASPPAAPATRWAASVASNFAAMSAATAASETARRDSAPQMPVKPTLVSGAGPSLPGGIGAAASPSSPLSPPLSSARVSPGVTSQPPVAASREPVMPSLAADARPAPPITPTHDSLRGNAPAPAREPFFDAATPSSFGQAPTLPYDQEFDEEPLLILNPTMAAGAADAARSAAKASRVPPDLPRQLKRPGSRAFLAKLAFTGVLLVGGAFVVAYVTGAFEGMPALSLEHGSVKSIVPVPSGGANPQAAESTTAAGDTHATSTTNSAAPAENADARTSASSNPTSTATAPASPAAVDPTQTLNTQPPSAGEPAPVVASVAPSTNASTTADPSEPADAGRSASAVTTDVAPTSAAKSTPSARVAADGAKAQGKHSKNSPPAPSRSATVAAAAAQTGPSTPRAACAGRTDFALYRCMQTQCKAARWSSNPQCIKLRSHDELD